MVSLSDQLVPAVEVSLSSDSSQVMNVPQDEEELVPLLAK